MGRCDGIQTLEDGTQTIVEVKNRQKYFFYPLYEKVQVHAYMALTGLNHCTFIQQLNNDSISVQEGSKNFIKKSSNWISCKFCVISFR